MADDKSKVGKPDRDRVSGSEKYEVTDFAQKFGITSEEARQLIDKHGNRRSDLEKAAKAMGRSS
jgi:hypothetical protein